jgi:hypothetical protein
MPFYSCTVNEVGPAANGIETSIPVVYINLTDTLGSFTNQWLYAAEGSQNHMLAVGLAAMNTNRLVEVAAEDPSVPYSRVDRMYLTLSSASLITPVIDLNGVWAAGGTPAATISVNENFLSIDLPGRPTASGTIVDRSDIVVNFPDATTLSGQLQPPSTIAWSNGSTWQKV